MWPYLITFMITNILLYITEKKVKKNKKLEIILLIISVLPLSILAGLRTIDLGWDVEQYGIAIYNRINSFTFTNLVAYTKLGYFEPGFLYLFYICIKIFNNINFVLFCLHIIITFSVLYFAYQNKEKSPILITMILYEFTLYFITYSTLRQCVSLALCFISCALYSKKKFKSAYLIALFGMFFHSSAIVSILTLLIMQFNDSKSISKKTKFLINFLLISALFIGIMNYEWIIREVSNAGIVSQRYENYLTNKYHSEHLVVRGSVVLLKTFNVILGLLYYKCKKINQQEKSANKKWYIMILIDYVVLFLSFKILNIHRITYYLYFPAIFAFIPQTVKVFKNDEKNRKLGYIIILLVYFLYFLQNLLWNYYDMYPYRSII